MIKANTRKLLRKIILRAVLPGFVLFALVGYLAIKPVLDTDSDIVFAAKMVSKSLVMGVLHTYETVTDEGYVPTPLDGDGFSYADLDIPEYSQIRDDQLFADIFLIKDQRWNFEDVVNASDMLWTNTTPGTPTRDWQQSNVVEMYQAVLEGQPFLCGDLTLMLMQLTQSGGLQARQISLSRSDGGGHIVIEVFVPEFNDWVVVDPTNNVYYKYNGNVLNALELYYLVQDDEVVSQIEKVYGAGRSLDEFPEDLQFTFDDFYRHGIAILFFNRWVEMTPARHNPIRSPAVMGVYLGNDGVRQIYYRHDFDPTNHDEDIAQLYAPPRLIH